MKKRSVTKDIIEAVLPVFFSKAIDKLGVRFLLTVIEPSATFIVVAMTDVKLIEAKPEFFAVDSMGRCIVGEKLVAWPTRLESKEKSNNVS